MSKYEKLPVFKGWVYERFPFIQEDFDSLTSYELWCKVVEYLNKNLKVTNEIGENEELLSNEFAQLVNYVNNYFENLDVQDEINSKLDDLVEDGTMSRIINEEIFTELSNRVSALESSVENIEEVIDSKLENINPKIVESFYYYVSNTTGSDDNDGLTTDTPFKTLNKALSFFASGQEDVRIQILDSSEYYFDDNFNAGSNLILHLNSTKTGNERPIIKFKRHDRSIAFYESHLNFQNLILSQDEPNIDSRVYIEGGCVGLTNIKFVNVDRFALQECSVAIDDLEVKRLQLHSVSGYINNLKITNSDIDRKGVEIKYSNGLRIYGNLEVGELVSNNTTDTSRLFEITYSNISLMPTFLETSLSNKYKYGIYAVNSNIFITKNRFNGFTAGNKFASDKPYLSNVSKIDGNEFSQSEWTNLPIISGTPGSGEYVPKYKIINNILFLTGTVSDLNQSDVIATIPQGFSAQGRHTFACSSDNSNQFSSVRVLNNGNIILHRGYNSTDVQIFLDSIIIPLEY